MRFSVAGLLRGTVDQLIGLIVDDGFVAVGAVLALLITGWLSANATELVPHNALGVFLFLVTSVFLLASLARAGVAARSDTVHEPVRDRGD
jgi:hypothetical protein